MKKNGKLKKFSQWPRWMKVAFVLEWILFVILIAGAAVIAKTANKIERIEVKEEVIEESITEEVEHKTGYLNVAIFGLDSRKGNLGKGNLSDTIIIASLNHETKEVKMVSVYRDTLLQIGKNSYNKANAAYSFYGPEGAIKMLNKNLDMNIDKYITVNFNAMVDVVDAVDGIDLELTTEEIVHMNNYCVETSKVTGKKYKKITPEIPGTYHLNGVQATSYTRIRYTEGGDAQRTVRQRIVIGKILEKVQNLNLSSVNKIIDNVFPQIATNFTLAEMISYAKDFKDYQLGESMGFPEKRSSHRLYKIGITEVADTLLSNVKPVHEFLFEDEEYEPSSTLKSISSEIEKRLSSGYYNEPVETKASDKTIKKKKDSGKKEDNKKEDNKKEEDKAPTGNDSSNENNSSNGNTSSESNGNNGGNSEEGTTEPKPPVVEVEPDSGEL